jgi:hypothetical protein
MPNRQKPTTRPTKQDKKTSEPRVATRKPNKQTVPNKAVRRKRVSRFNYSAWRENRAAYHAKQLPLPGVWQTTKQAFKLLWRYKRLFLGIILIYGVLNLILVQGFTNTADVSGIKGALSSVFHGAGGGVASALTIFVTLAGSSNGTGSGTGSSGYQVILLLIVSLALIWSLRQVFAGVKIRVRDAYYRGMSPLISFVLVLLVMGLQLIPLIIGAAIYGIVIVNGVAATGLEQIVWFAVFALFAAWSLFLICSSIFALYIVTLPDMTPMKALRSARELVRYRRWTLLLRIIYLPILLLVIAAVIMTPIIIFVTVLSQWIFFLLTLFGIAVVHTYMYILYRGLLHE